MTRSKQYEAVRGFAIRQEKLQWSDCLLAENGSTANIVFAILFLECTAHFTQVKRKRKKNKKILMDILNFHLFQDTSSKQRMQHAAVLHIEVLHTLSCQHLHGRRESHAPRRPQRATLDSRDVAVAITYKCFIQFRSIHKSGIKAARFSSTIIFFFLPSW